MRRLARSALVLALVTSTSALSQISPVPDGSDFSDQRLTLSDGAIGRLPIPQSGLTLVLPADERIDTVVLGDPAAYSVAVEASGSALTIRPLGEGRRSMLSVSSGTTAYYFELEPAGGTSALSRVRVTPPPALARLDDVDPSAAPTDAEVVETPYKLSGSRALRPVSVLDDGARTYIEFAPDQALPAVFGVGPTGKEEVTDGHVRDGFFVLDRVWPELVFRIDENRARAKRIRRR